MSHSNIAIFVPHLGCPHQCSFCNQKHITGQSVQPTKQDIEKAVATAVSSNRFDSKAAEIAFFGGSFTAIDRNYMLELLECAYSYVANGVVSGIRVSTRPDCIDAEILDILKKYGVTAIELGAQSMVDSVLVSNNRGHRAEDVVNASNQVKSYGFELGLQMMTGLYTSSDELDIITAERLIELKPNTVRIYPTIILKNTELEQRFVSGEYKPADIESAVKLAALLDDMFVSNGIKVIRIGLHSIDESAYVAGPWHPAFRELCDSMQFRNKLEKQLISGHSYEVLVSPKALSKAIGQKKANIDYFLSKNIEIVFKTQDGINPLNFIVKEVK